MKPSNQVKLQASRGGDYPAAAKNVLIRALQEGKCDGTKPMLLTSPSMQSYNTNEEIKAFPKGSTDSSQAGFYRLLVHHDFSA
jgi:hypothetical protein